MSASATLLQSGASAIVKPGLKKGQQPVLDGLREKRSMQLSVRLKISLYPPRTENAIHKIVSAAASPENSCKKISITATSLNAQVRNSRSTDGCIIDMMLVRGRCTNQKCTCRRGYEGPDCQIDTKTNSQCSAPSLLDNEGDCCSSGVFDYTGVCCDGLNSETDIDIDGNCCVGRPLDACGRCDEDTQYYLDAAGQCCEVFKTLQLTNA